MPGKLGGKTGEGGGVPGLIGGAIYQPVNGLDPKRWGENQQLTKEINSTTGGLGKVLWIKPRGRAGKRPGDNQRLGLETLTKSTENGKRKERKKE